jgi:hypothetical protein
MNIRTLAYLFACSLVACNAAPETAKKTAEVKWEPGMELSKVNFNTPVQNANFPRNNTNSTSTSTASTPTVNPAHGLAGHRCDLAVGAPLPKANAATQSVTMQQGSNVDIAALAKTQPAAMQKPPVVTAKGMNPPHGQPYHRCDIAVGAPLNAKPGTAATAINTVPAPEPPKFNAQGKMLNPSHGQPKHRCDIAVGELLDSKPVQATTTPPVTDQKAINQPATGQSQNTNPTGQKLKP